MSEPQRFQPVPPKPRAQASTPPPAVPSMAPPPAPSIGPFASPPGGYAAQAPAPFVPSPSYAAPAAHLPAGAKPSRSTGWAIASILFFWPCAIPAFVYGGRVDQAWLRGDHQAAVQAARSARLWGMLGTLVPIALLLIAAIVGGFS